MANATALPTSSQLLTFQASRPTAQTPALQTALNATDVTSTVKLNGVLKDGAGAVCTGGILLGVKVGTGYTEHIWCPLASSTDGQTFTACVRGIKLNGLDYTVGVSTNVVSHAGGEEVFLGVTAVLENLSRSALQGGIATGATGITFGTDSGSETVTLYRTTGAGTKVGFFRWSTTSSKAEFSNDGTTWTANSSVSASDLMVVSATDTTPGYLSDKLVSGGGIDFNIVNAGGNETYNMILDLTEPGLVPGTLAHLISDVTSTVTEVNRLSGISANVTAANLNTLTAGATSNADALHTHNGLTSSVAAIEAIDGSSTAKPIAILGNNYKGVQVFPANGRTFFSTVTGTTRATGNIDAQAKRSQSFTITDALATSISIESITILLEVVGAPADYCTLELSADVAGYPGTTILGFATPISGASLTVNARPQKFTFASPVVVPSGTTIHWALRRSDVAGAASALNAAAYYSLFDANANVGVGTSASYTASTLTWSGSTTTDFQCIIQYNLDYDGKAAIADGNTFPRTRLKGFTTSNVAGGASIAMSTEIATGLSLTNGAEYYLDTAQGVLTATAPSLTSTFGAIVPKIYAGQALNSTTLKIDPKYDAMLAISDIYSSGQPITQSTDDAIFDVFIETGFPPRELEIQYAVTNAGGTATDDRTVLKVYSGITIVQSMYFRSGSAAEGGTSSFANDAYITVQAIYENGFLLRFFSTADSEDLGSLQVYAKA